MEYKHLGNTVASLSAIPIATIANTDYARIWINNYTRKMVFDSTATNATDTTNHPYYIRPTDYGAGPGVWIEDVGADENQVWNAGQIIGSQLTSTNWGASTGSQLDLDAGTIKLGGSSSPAFSVTAAGAVAATSGAIGGWTLGATSLTSTNVGIHSGASAQILLGHATDYATAKIGLKNDGSGKLASGKIYWDSSGNITLDVPANAGTGVGVIYKGGARWLYDFNPAHNGAVQPNGYNLFLGVEAGNLTMGSSAANVNESSYNVGVGYQCLNALTTGQKNIAAGYRSLYSNTTGYYNVAIGESALHTNTTGQSCVGVGLHALYSNVGGDYNTAIGDTALYTNSEGDSNTALGIQSLYSNTTGSYNTSCGAGALYSNTEGQFNCALGNSSMRANTTGGYNVAIGKEAGRYQNNGATELVTPENSVYIGAEAKSGSDPDGGEDNIQNEIVVGYTATGNGTNTVTLGNTFIGELHCQVALTVDSDERIKRDITPLPSTSCLDFINALSPVTFRHKNPFDYPDEIKPCNFKDRTVKEKDHKGKEKTKLIKADKRPPDNDTVRIGLLAGEVERLALLHGIGAKIVTTSNRGKKAITYEALIMPLISAVQELSKQVGALN